MKNLTSVISVLLVMVFLLGTCMVSANQAMVETYSLGDVNGDQNVSAQDALLVLKYAVGKANLTDNQFQAAEVTGDGFLNAVDALEILKYAVGKSAKFPIEEMMTTPTDVTSTCINQ